MNTQILEHIDIALLIPYARNSRTHSPEQVQQVANSIKEFGFTNPVLIDGENGIIAGHGRVMAAQSLGLDQVPCIRLAHLTEAQKKAYIIADNQLALNSGWDEDMLRIELQDLQKIEFDLGLIGFDADFLEDLLLEEEKQENTNNADSVPAPPAVPVTKPGDVWLLGNHRVMCGDSTSVDAVEKLMCGKKAALIHADPPYGMGKESDGVANDNLYGKDLDQFQMSWWTTFRLFSEDNAGVYIWGNSADLWRLWYTGGLRDSENLYFCNHIVWDKKNIAGMASPLLLKYPIASEHCLFFKIGEQFIGNVNADQYWDGWDDIRLPLKEQADKAGLNSKMCMEITGVGMYSHWFSKSQWQLIPKNYYLMLQSALPDYFAMPYTEIRSKYDQIKGGYRSHINGIQGGLRTYFDNAHEVMRDVWEFSRVIGNDRHGHATPKPVNMMCRVMKSSLPMGGVCAEPFGGSGSTLMGAEETGRVCYTMEMQEIYCDVIVKRWQNYTGKQARLETTGQTFDELANG